MRFGLFAVVGIGDCGEGGDGCRIRGVLGLEEKEGEDAAAQHDSFVSGSEENVVCWEGDGSRVAGFEWDGGRGLQLQLGLGWRAGGEGGSGENGGVGAADGVVEGGSVQEGGVEEVGGLSSGFQRVGSEGQGGGGGEEREEGVFWVGHYGFLDGNGAERSQRGGDEV